MYVMGDSLSTREELGLHWSVQRSQCGPDRRKCLLYVICHYRDGSIVTGQARNTRDLRKWNSVKESDCSPRSTTDRSGNCKINSIRFTFEHPWQKT